MGRVSIKAVALGIITDIGGSIVAGIILLAMFAGHVFSEPMSPQELDEALKPITQSGPFLITSLIAGLSFTALGGYVAARVAGKEIYLNAGLVGVFSLLAGLTFGGEYPVWFNIAGLVLIIPAALYGGHLAEGRTAD